MLDYLPQEVLIDVFTRLPTKNLLRCTCICKSWHSLITNPSFISTHLNRLQTIPHNNAHHLFLFLNSSPSRKEEIYSRRCDNNALYCAQDDVAPSEIDVYSMRAGAGETLAMLVFGIGFITQDTAAFDRLSIKVQLVGLIHLMLLLLFNWLSTGWTLLIFAYALLPGPPIVFRGWLALVECGKRSEEDWCIWVMKEYGLSESWTKLLVINVGHSVERLVGFRKNGDLLILADGGQLISYDTEAASSTKLGIGGTIGYRCLFKLESYTESVGFSGSQVHGVQNGVEDCGGTGGAYYGAGATERVGMLGPGAVQSV
ncbi:hypothetical protein Acr_00g0096040 [Actinidia rufa]|uniref:F-box domain-containing protein n=1 Tax=Actinidia rufa TaxID=165716 RepID=A0A7J0E0B6_9ERIC|nr:hypothetical protein Acr_00g0096040 [Actinidia rufa]